ncbi:DUF4227 family protein [Paenibacillus yonginensis]|uniref:DUF4227 family protein n=1 Tax=Paenibacillus yonginensis TaxID=1462996 RepID=UPI000837ADD5|nr:DUF4227 family protein [Paenibacillus yonginensis]
MVISVRKWLKALRFFLLFCMLVYVFSKLFGIFEHWLNPGDPYRYPEGSAVKAGSMQVHQEEQEDMLERLKLFYRLGE